MIPSEPEEDQNKTDIGEEFIIEEVDIPAMKQQLSTEQVSTALLHETTDVMKDTTWTQLFDTVSQ